MIKDLSTEKKNLLRNVCLMIKDFVSDNNEEREYYENTAHGKVIMPKVTVNGQQLTMKKGN